MRPVDIDLNAPAIVVRDLVVRYPGTRKFPPFRAVDGVSFSIPRGQVCALLGPNGAGKTTTIQCLLGMLEPTCGSVEIFGVPVLADRVAAMSRTNFLGTYGAYPGSLYPEEIVRAYAYLYGVKNVDEAVEMAMAEAGIEDLRGKKYVSLSSGQQTLVSLAKALVNDPDLLFLDEPTANLDPERAHQLRHALMARVEKRNTTVLITSHNLSEVERMSERVLFLAQGRIVADASPQELREKFDAQDLEEVFLTIAKEVK